MKGKMKYEKPRLIGLSGDSELATGACSPGNGDGGTCGFGYSAGRACQGPGTSAGGSCQAYGDKAGTSCQLPGSSYGVS